MDIKKVLTEAVSEAVQKGHPGRHLERRENGSPGLYGTAPKSFWRFCNKFCPSGSPQFSLPCPAVIADAVVKYLDCSAVEKMEVAGPGFLNFYLKSDWLYEGLARILEKGGELWEPSQKGW